MASVEVIALLCAGSTRYHDAGRSSSTDKLSKGEMAGLLAGLSRESMNLALAKYALDVDAERMLIAHVRVFAAGLAVKEDWHIVRGRPVLSNMAALAVFDVVRPNRCKRCSGRGLLTYRSCSVCSGSGYKALSGRQIAEAIGVDEKCYRRLWKARFESLVAYLQGINSAVSWALYHADRDRVDQAA